MAVEKMRPLRYVTLAIYLVGAALLVMGHSFDDLKTAPVSDAPTITAADDDTIVTVWTPPYKKLEFRGLPPENPRSPGSSEIDETYVRPAWGMFAATVGFFLHVWTNTMPCGVML